VKRFTARFEKKVQKIRKKSIFILLVSGKSLYLQRELEVTKV
jgi:hypothetical protein